MASGISIRAAGLAGLLSLFAACLVAWPLAQGDAGAAELSTGEAQTQRIVVAASDFGSRAVTLGIGKSVVIDFPHDIKDVLVANPKIANAVIRSSRRAYIIGSEVGQTNVFFFDAEGRQMVGLDIAVTRNLNGIRTAISHSRLSTSRCGLSAADPPPRSVRATKSSTPSWSAAAIRSCSR
jgi:pilus assembly protein CpaC